MTEQKTSNTYGLIEGNLDIAGYLMLEMHSLGLSADRNGVVISTKQSERFINTFGQSLPPKVVIIDQDFTAWKEIAPVVSERSPQTHVIFINSENEHPQPTNNVTYVDRRKHLGSIPEIVKGIIYPSALMT